MKHFCIALAAFFSSLGLACAEPVTYNLDPSHTFVTFESQRYGIATARGRWDKKEGSVVLDRSAKTGRIEVTIEVASITTGVAPFDGAMRGESFFDAAKHPKAQFVGTDLVFDGDKLKEVRGQLTIKGSTQPIALKALSFGCYTNTRINREVCGGDFEAFGKRSSWGVMGSGISVAVPDEFRLTIQVEGIRQ